MKKTLVMAGVALGLGLVFDWFFFGHNPGINFPIYTLLIIVAFAIISRVFEIKISTATRMVSSLAMIFSFFVFWRSSPFLTALNLLTTLYLILLMSYSIFRPLLRSFRLRDYFMPVAELPLNYFRSFFSAMGELLSLRTKVRGHEQTSKVARGIVMVLPFLIIFIILFSSADLVFQKHLYDLFDISIDPSLLVRIIIIMGMASALLGAFWFVFRKAEPHFRELPNSYLRIGSVESSVGMGLLNALFLLFIIIQIRYLFGGVMNITVSGLTYADYARKGFFELIAVAAISLVLIWVADKFIEHRSIAFKVLTSVFIVQVFVIMASSFKRLALYEHAYGFTTIRLYSHLTIIFIAILFFALLYKILVNHRDEAFLLSAFVSAVVFLALVNIGNPDAYIARKNIELFASTGKIDIDYMTSLSDDALGEMRKVPQIPESRFEIKKHNDWQSYHL